MGWETALLGMRDPPSANTHTQTNNSSKMHLCNCIKCGQLALFSRPTAVTRFNTCNCTVRYLNKECGGLPMPREPKKKKSWIKRKQHDSNKQYTWMYPVLHRLSLLCMHHKQHNTSILLASSFLFLFTWPAVTLLQWVTVRRDSPATTDNLLFVSLYLTSQGEIFPQIQTYIQETVREKKIWHLAKQ